MLGTPVIADFARPDHQELRYRELQPLSFLPLLIHLPTSIRSCRSNVPSLVFVTLAPDHGV